MSLAEKYLNQYEVERSLVHENNLKLKVMKNRKSIIARLTVLLGITILAVLGILISCEKENFTPISENSMVKTAQTDLTSNELPMVDICGTMMSKKLLTDQKKEVGTAFLFNDTKYFYVHAAVNADYKVKNAYLFTGKKDEIPLTTAGDPDFQHFNHQIVNQGFSTVRSFKIPLEELTGKFSVALMLQVLPKNDTYTFLKLKAWGEGQSFGTTIGKRGMFFPYEKGVCLYIDRDEPAAANE